MSFLQFLDNHPAVIIICVGITAVTIQYMTFAITECIKELGK